MPSVPADLLVFPGCATRPRFAFKFLPARPTTLQEACLPTNGMTEVIEAITRSSGGAPPDQASPDRAAHAPAPAAADADVTAGSAVAQVLLDSGLITIDQLEYARRVRGRLPAGYALVRVLKDLGVVSQAQVRECLRTRRVPARLGDLLVELGYLSEADLRLALRLQQEQPDTTLGAILIENDLASEQDVYEVLAYQLGLVHVPASDCIAHETLSRLAPVRWLRSNELVPIRQDGDSILIAFARPLDPGPVAAAKRVFGPHLTAGIATRRAVEAAIARLEAEERPVAATANDNVVVTAVETMLSDALRARASDIHVEPMRDRIRVRFRRDGVLIPYKDLPIEMAAALASRIKVMAGADIGDRRRHQDGRILYETPRGPIDVRASFYVTVHGEKTVLRLLNNRETLLRVGEIGMAPRMMERYREDVLDAASGVIIITGPTGSGKTTTLYASVNHLNDARTSIITAEDPVEYMIDGIAQCSICARINLSYEETLKHIVRQDPDVIVIGEIRDLFSAETAIQAALTGHKVLTTFHTEDSIGGLLRLLNMNIEAFLISSTVVSVVAQRLVRRVCPSCAEDQVLTPHEIDRLGYQPRDLAGVVFKVGRGCSACNHLGYLGRTAVFELLVLNEAVKEAVLQKRTSYEIRRISAQTSGLVTLLEDGILKAAQGVTSHEELIRCLPRLLKPRPVAELRRLLGVPS
jgi:type IV pilus assembly protein PilB